MWLSREQFTQRTLGHGVELGRPGRHQVGNLANLTQAPSVDRPLHPAGLLHVAGIIDGGAVDT